ncbi:hypothetical protein CI238_12565 [Colletotrichum incanum]|uniref:Integral membrane protein n=1 Tax=Colletotrichum incanum TaxID=1573173 RepID=A0A161VYS6_COLIC|nr:hypothetical protein CI238_12565 [Colletotrichum incanum]
MAPKRGKGGSSGGNPSIPASCPGAFSSQDSLVDFVLSILVFVFFVAVFFSRCSSNVRVSAGKKLIGLPYVLSVICFLIGYACLWISLLLRECEVGSYYDFYYWAIAVNILIGIGNWLLLFVIVWTLNTMLQEHLGYRMNACKVICIVIIAVTGMLTCARIGLNSYNLWTVPEYWLPSETEILYDAYPKLNVAYWGFYLLSTITSGVFSLITTISLKSRRFLSSRLLGWIVTLLISNVIWVLLIMVLCSSAIIASLDSWTTRTVVGYTADIFQALSCLLFIFVAKDSAWSMETSTGTNTIAAATHHQPIMFIEHQQYLQDAQESEKLYYQK